MRSRFRQQPYLKKSSSFPDRATAEYAISEALKANKGKINAFMSGSEEKAGFRHSLPKDIGVVALRNDVGLTSTNKIVVVLVKDASMPDGFFILTGYPET